MRIAVFGKGKVGGGLPAGFEAAGHQVTWAGRHGGDASEADVCLVPVPGGSVVEALEKVSGVQGNMVIDGTDRIGVNAPEGFVSYAEFVKSRTGRPTVIWRSEQRRVSKYARSSSRCKEPKGDGRVRR